MENCGCGGECGCGNETNEEGCGCSNFSRKYFTKDEEIEQLKEYKEALEKEAKGVAERIKELQKEK